MSLPGPRFTVQDAPSKTSPILFAFRARMYVVRDAHGEVQDTTPTDYHAACVRAHRLNAQYDPTYSASGRGIINAYLFGPHFIRERRQHAVQPKVKP